MTTGRINQITLPMQYQPPLTLTRRNERSRLTHSSLSRGKNTVQHTPTLSSPFDRLRAAAPSEIHQETLNHHSSTTAKRSTASLGGFHAALTEPATLQRTDKSHSQRSHHRETLLLAPQYSQMLFYVERPARRALYSLTQASHSPKKERLDSLG